MPPRKAFCGTAGLTPRSPRARSLVPSPSEFQAHSRRPGESSLHSPRPDRQCMSPSSQFFSSDALRFFLHDISADEKAQKLIHPPSCFSGKLAHPGEPRPTFLRPEQDLPPPFWLALGPEKPTPPAWRGIALFSVVTFEEDFRAFLMAFFDQREIFGKFYLASFFIFLFA